MFFLHNRDNSQEVITSALPNATRKYPLPPPKSDDNLDDDDDDDDDDRDEDEITTPPSPSPATLGYSSTSDIFRSTINTVTETDKVLPTRRTADKVLPTQRTAEKQSTKIPKQKATPQSELASPTPIQLPVAEKLIPANPTPTSIIIQAVSPTKEVDEIGEVKEVDEIGETNEDDEISDADLSEEYMFTDSAVTDDLRNIHWNVSSGGSSGGAGGSRFHE